MPEEMLVRNVEGKCDDVGVWNDCTDCGESPKTIRHILWYKCYSGCKSNHCVGND